MTLLEATTVTEDPRTDRDWEHWPGRGAVTDEGIRHRLRALFSATDDGGMVEARIEEAGREIEEHTVELQATISDLERREERAGQLRSAVEEMLRQGSAELDERHAELTKLSLELAAREERVRADERDIAVRKQELGAVELRRAAVERREAVAAEREVVLERLAADLAGQGDETPPHASADPAGTLASAESHVLVFADGGYRSLERAGAPARVGTLVNPEGTPFVVVRHGRAPRPGDRRAWVYLDAVPPLA
jgi:hypothetical protein